MRDAVVLAGSVVASLKLVFLVVDLLFGVGARHVLDEFVARIDAPRGRAGCRQNGANGKGR